MSQTWDQKRKLLLRLGTKKYEKPSQLSSCEPVLDFAKNQLTEAENYVEPIRPDDTFIYSNTTLFVCGLPNLKKGFRRNFSFWFQGSEKRTYLKTLYRIKNPMVGFEIG